MINDGFTIEKRIIKSGTHPADVCWFITSDNGRFIEQGPYSSVEDAIEDSRQKYYNERSLDVQLGLDMVVNSKIISCS